MYIIPTLHIICSVVYITVAMFILTKSARAMSNRLCAAIIIGFAVWSMTQMTRLIPNSGLSKDTIILFGQIGAVGWAGIPALGLLLIIEIVGLTEKLKIKYIFPILFIPLVIILFTIITDYTSMMDYTPDQHGRWVFIWQKESYVVFLFFGYYLTYMFASIGIGFTSLLDEDNYIKKMQMAIITATMFVAVVVVTAFNILVKFLVADFMYSIGSISVSVWVFGLLVAMTKYDLFNKTIEEKLAISNKKLKSVVDTSPAGIIGVDLNGIVEIWNPACEKMFGWTEKEAVGNRNPTLPKDQNETFDNDVKNQEAFVREIQSLCKDGTLVNIELVVSPYFDNGGEVAGMLGVLTDITERKRTEIAMKESEKSYRTIFNNSQVALFKTRIHDGKILNINKRFAEMAGYDNIEECMVEFSILKAWVIPGARDEFLEIIKKDDFVRNYETEILCKDDRRIWINFSATMFPEQGTLEGSIEDITERKNAEELQRKSEKLYRTLVETSNDGIILTGLDGVYLFANQKQADIFGYDNASDMIGLNGFDMFTPESIEFARETFEKLMIEKIVENACFEVIKKDGSIIIAEFSASLVIGEDGIPNSIMCITKDVTKRKRDEKALLEKQRMNEMLLNSLPHPAMIITRDRKILASNQIGIEAGAIVGGICWRDFGHCASIPEKARKDIESNITHERKIMCTFCQADECLDGYNHKQDPDVHVADRIFDTYWIAIDDDTFLHYAIDITDRKKSEMALRESEEKHRAYIENAPDGIFVINENGKYLEVNGAACKMTGYSKEELLNMTIQELAGKHVLHDKSPFLKLKETGKVYAEIMIEKKDGTDIQVFISAVRLNAESYMAFCSDITERKETEKELETHRNQLEELVAERTTEIGRKNIELDTLLNNIPDMAWLKNVDSEFIAANKSFGDMVGIEPEKLVNESCEICFGKEVADQFRKDDKEVMEGREQVIFEEKITDIDGEDVWLETLKSPIFNSIGEVIGTVGVARNITERKSIDEELEKYREHLEELVHDKTQTLQKSEKNYRNILDNMIDVFYRADTTGVIVMASRYGAELLGYANEDLIGMNLAKDLYYDPRDRVAFTEALQKTGRINNYNVTLKKKNGDPIVGEVNAYTIFDEQGKPIGVEGIFRDSSERNRLEDQLRQSQKMEAVGNLAGGIAHDFNNILGAIMLNTEMAIAKTKDEDAVSYMDQINRSTIRARDLIKQILTFSKKSVAGSKKVGMNIGNIVDEVVQFLRASIPVTTKIENNIRKGFGAIKGDPTQIYQIIINLCTNSFNAIGENEDGIIRVMEREFTIHNSNELEIPVGKYVGFDIIDNGSGIPHEIIDRIFEPFFTTGIDRGTGMGLPVVHGIIKSHGGFFDVESKPGQTIFMVMFPIYKEVEKITNTTKTKRVMGTGSILFVDDNLDYLDSATSAIKHLGYNIDICENGDEAIDKFVENPDKYNLIITDYSMPGMNGIQLSGKINEIKKIPVILCTGYADFDGYGNTLDITDEMKNNGIKHVITKPFGIDDISEKIEDVINNT